MDESGSKILIGILIAIVGGVSLYIAVFGITAQPTDSSNQASNRPTTGGVISPEASAVARAMIGTWQSTTDTKFTREFRDDSTVIDRYTSNPPVTKKGIWGVFTSDMAVAGAATGLSPGVVYVQTTTDGDSLYFRVVQAADTLELVYLNNGSHLNFTRVQ